MRQLRTGNRQARVLSVAACALALLASIASSNLSALAQQQANTEECPSPETVDAKPKTEQSTTPIHSAQNDLSSATGFVSWWLKRAMRCDGYADGAGDPLIWLDGEAKTNFKRLFQSPDAEGLGSAVVFAPIDMTPQLTPDGTTRVSISGDLVDQTGVISMRANHIEVYVLKNADGYRITRFELPALDESKNALLFKQSKDNIERIPVVKQAFVLYLSGYRALQKGDHKKAEEFFSKAIELRPRLALAYRGRSAARVELGNYPGAITDGEQACILLRGEAPLAYLSRGRCFEAASDWKGADSTYSQAINYDPFLAEAFSHRARVRRELGNNLGAQGDDSEATRLQLNAPSTSETRASTSDELAPKP